MGPSVNSDESNMICFGETITSWRSLLKRTTAWLRLGTSDYARLPVLPTPSVDDTIPGVGARYNNIFEWVGRAYVATRGSVRVAIYPINASNNRARIVRGDRPFPGVSIIENADDALLDSLFRLGGSAFVQSNCFSPLHVEVPWYSPYRFSPVRNLTPVYDSDSGTTPMWFETVSNSATAVCISSAEDFAYFFFLCTPVVERVERTEV